MTKVVAIEGIDRIGKSTFIDKLKQKLEELGETVSVEKPTIGINTLKKIGYPLQDVSNIMEIRNIGLMEEFLYRVQTEKRDIIIIRDRFNLSELAYGIVYRRLQFKETLKDNISTDAAIAQYSDWNSWFEKEMDKASSNLLIVFILDEQSYPNDDEAISASNLVPVNNMFNMLFEMSCFKNKKLIKLHKDETTGFTDIMSYLGGIYEQIIKL